jgi:ADP-heptose:LPS heptosyltransferase
MDYLAEEGPAAAALGHPALNRVLTLGRGWPGLPAPPLLLAALRRARYDWVIDLYGNPRSALLARVTGAPVRVGPARRLRRRLFTHAIPPQDPRRSAIDYHLSALGALGVSPGPARTPRIYLSDVERAEGAARLDQAAPPGQPRVGLHVGNRWPAKRWPEERFSALLRALSKLGARGIVLAGPGEEALARRVADGARVAGRGLAPVIAGLPLRSYFAVVAALDALVTNDGLQDVIEIARQARIPAEFYHLKAAGQSNWAKLDDLIRKIEAARKEGLKITADMYTYTAGATGLDAAMPPWVQEGGYKAWAERLKDPAI